MSDTAPIVAGGYSLPQSIYETSTVKHHNLGTRGTLPDGRVFYYARSTGAALGRGVLCRKPADTAHISIAAAANAAGATSVNVTLASASASAGQYEDGTLLVIDGTNSGQCRRIEYHAAQTSSSGVLTAEIDFPLEAALTTSEEVALVKNAYADVVITPGDAVVAVAGVPQVAVPAGTTDTQYFWLQTFGRAAVVGDNSTFVLGGMVSLATATTDDAGQCTIVAGTASNASVVPQVVIGTLDTLGDASSDGDFRLVDLRIRG